jgi:hypothetical protein
MTKEKNWESLWRNMVVCLDFSCGNWLESRFARVDICRNVYLVVLRCFSAY